MSPLASPAKSLVRTVRSGGRRVVAAMLEHSPLASRYFWRLPCSARGAALTFDDGPHPEITPRVLDLLAGAGRHATFFVVGQQARRYPELVQRMVREGHAVGNHTFTHARCPALRSAELQRELTEADALLRDLGVPGEIPFRPPFGELRLWQARQLLACGRRVVLWSRDSRDYRGASPEAIAATADLLQRRDILLLHDRFETTLAALPALLKRLGERELETVTLSGPHSALEEARPAVAGWGRPGASVRRAG